MRFGSITRVSRTAFAIGFVPLLILATVIWVRSFFVIPGIELRWWRGPAESTERSFVLAAVAGVGEINFTTSTQVDSAGHPMYYSSSAHSASRESGRPRPVVCRVLHLRLFDLALHTYYRKRPLWYRPSLETVDQTMQLGVAPPMTNPGQVWRQHFLLLTIPLWLLVVGFSIPPGMATVRLVRRRCRAAAGRCLSCGYDLRGNSDSAVCPECGSMSNARRCKR